MSDIDHMRIRRLDGAVLLVFLGLMRARKATVVAAQLGLTQSSISHALKRLREAFGDPLFLRRPHGLEPTAVARLIEPQVRTAVEALNIALTGPEAFDPSRDDRILRVGAYDHALTTLVPKFLADLREEAPNMRLAAHAVGRTEALSALSLNTIDLAIGYFWSLPPDFVATPLFEETYLVAGPKAHAFFQTRPSLKRYIAADHVITSPSGDLTGIVDRTLASEGLERCVVASAPLFMPALAMAQQLGALVTAPRRFLLAHAAKFGLVTARPPLAIRPFDVSVVHAKRDERDPLRTWAIGLLRASSASGGASSPVVKP